ncbi:MAG: hypothetical protein SGARI_004139, partial [Bacillariaceae sp.]
MLVAVPNFAVSYSVYGTLKEYTLDDELFYNLRRIDADSGEPKLGFFLTILCGAASGFVATGITFPMDTIRRRMQIQNLHVDKEHRLSSAEQLLRLVRDEGLTSLYRGLTPEMLKVIPMVGTMFVVYEWSKEWLNMLAFADIQVQHVEDDGEDGNNHNKDQDSCHPQQEEIIQVVFHRKAAEDDDTGDDSTINFVWEEDMPGNKFPEKTLALPYGALVAVNVCSKSMQERNNNRKSYAVKSWELLQNPREEAIDKARINTGGEGISCSKYLQSRADAFLKFNPQAANYGDKPKQHQNKEGPNNTNEGEFGHGDNRAKALRAKIFAAWLMETYGRHNLLANGVLDVAGGKGKLSIELSLQGKIPCTIVDPLIRKHGDKLDPRDAKRMKKASCPHPKLLSREFNQTTFLEDCSETVTSSSLLVGLHPD